MKSHPDSALISPKLPNLRCGRPRRLQKNERKFGRQIANGSVCVRYLAVWSTPKEGRFNSSMLVVSLESVCQGLRRARLLEVQRRLQCLNLRASQSSRLWNTGRYSESLFNMFNLVQTDLAAPSCLRHLPTAECPQVLSDDDARRVLKVKLGDLAQYGQRSADSANGIEKFREFRCY